MKKLLALLLCLCLLLTAVGCAGENQGSTDSSESLPSASNTAADNVFVLGAPQPMTGTNANAGIDALNAINLAAEQINAKGGLLGQYTVKVVSYDDQGTPEEAVKISSKMIEVDHVNAVIGSCISSCVLASSAVLNENKIVTFGTGTSPTWMQQGWDYVFRACQNADFALPTLVDYWNQLEIHSISIFAGQDDAATAAVATVETLCGEAGIEILASESHVDGDTDFSGQCAKIVNTNADAVFVATFGSTQPLIVKQLRQYGFNGLIFTKDLFQSDSLAVAGEAGEHVGFAYPYLTYTDIASCTVENVKEFLTAYYDTYGEMPNTDTAYRAYDSAMVLFTAIENAGSINGEAVKDAVNQITGYVGLGGTFDYSMGDGEGLHNCSVYVVLNGEYVLFDEWIASGEYEVWLQE